MPIIPANWATEKGESVGPGVQAILGSKATPSQGLGEKHKKEKQKRKSKNDGIHIGSLKEKT